MNRRKLVLLGAAALLAASAVAAPAARLPVSTVTVEILFVDPQSYQRDEYRREIFKDGAVSSTWTEKTAVTAKARVKAVVVDDGHGLSPGTVIDINYEVVRGSGPVYGTRAPEVKSGEIWTVGVSGRGTSFEGGGWTKPRTDGQAYPRNDAATHSNVGARP